MCVYVCVCLVVRIPIGSQAKEPLFQVSSILAPSLICIPVRLDNDSFRTQNYSTTITPISIHFFSFLSSTTTNLTAPHSSHSHSASFLHFSNPCFCCISFNMHRYLLAHSLIFHSHSAAPRLIHKQHHSLQQQKEGRGEGGLEGGLPLLTY